MHRVEEEDSSKPNKPIYARRLNFGQSVLTLDPVSQFQGQKDGVLLIDKGVANIPGTKKVEYVRTWINSHTDCALESNNTLRLSPILGSSANKREQTSPVFGRRFKRVKASSSDRICSNKVQHAFRNEISSLPIENNRLVQKNDNKNKKENVRRNLFNSKSITTRVETLAVNTSPVLSRNLCNYKTKRKKLADNSSPRKVLEKIENRQVEISRSASKDNKMYVQTKSPVLIRNRRGNSEHTFPDDLSNSYVDSNMNSVSISELQEERYMETSYRVMCTQKQQQLAKMLKKNLESFLNKDSNISEDSKRSDSSVKSQLSIKDSPKDHSPKEIDAESSELNDNCNDIVTTNSDTDNHLSDQIEDTDTQDIVPATKNRNEMQSNRISFFADNKPSSISSQISDKDSDQTYCEEAEQVRRTFSNLRSSQTISQIYTQLSNPTESKSNESGLTISTQTTPRRTYPDPSVQLNLLDSGKKRKKPKKGSLSERLQSVINRQVSFARIWRHQLKQMDKDGNSVPCVTVYVRACFTRFSRQFLEGNVIEDPFELLPIKQSNDKSSMLIRIMIIPNIVGRVEMKSEGTIQIFPPWEVLDNEKLNLAVIYIRIVAGNGKYTVKNEGNAKHVKRLTVKEFNCSCISSNKMISSCTERLNKPNVIKQLFSD